MHKSKIAGILSSAGTTNNIELFVLRPLGS